MENNLEESLFRLREGIMVLARELHANQTFDKKLAEVKNREISEIIFIHVQLIAALNGDICNGLKASRTQSLVNLLEQLSEVQNAVQADENIETVEKDKLSEFINKNISSISNVLTRTFNMQA